MFNQTYENKEGMVYLADSSDGRIRWFDPFGDIKIIEIKDLYDRFVIDHFGDYEDSSESSLLEEDSY